MSPIDTNHRSKLELILKTPRLLGFTAPIEGAIHIHFDPLPLCSANIFVHIVNVFHTHGQNLKRLVGTNPTSGRLGNWDIALLKLVNEPGFWKLS